jgi:hypothetical protein
MEEQKNTSEQIMEEELEFENEMAEIPVAFEVDQELM